MQSGKWAVGQIARRAGKRDDNETGGQANGMTAKQIGKETY